MAGIRRCTGRRAMRSGARPAHSSASVARRCIGFFRSSGKPGMQRRRLRARHGRCSIAASSPSPVPYRRRLSCRLTGSHGVSSVRPRLRLMDVADQLPSHRHRLLAHAHPVVHPREPARLVDRERGQFHPLEEALLRIGHHAFC